MARETKEAKRAREIEERCGRLETHRVTLKKVERRSDLVFMCPESVIFNQNGVEYHALTSFIKGKAELVDGAIYDIEARFYKGCLKHEVCDVTIQSGPFPDDKYR